MAGFEVRAKLKVRDGQLTNRIGVQPTRFTLLQALDPASVG